MKYPLIVALAGILALGGLAPVQATEQANGERDKYLIILQAGKEAADGMARALHALLYAQELHESGAKVALVFDGAGVAWIEEWTNPESEHPLKAKYEELHALDLTEVICDYCAGAMKVKDALAGREVEFSGEFKGHPSIARWTEKGYRIVVL